MGRLYGYARVSSRDQNLDRQFKALEDFGVKRGNVFADKASGKDFQRPQWRRLMGHLGSGDVLAVKSIDRLGRDYQEILEEWRVLTKERKAGIVVLDMPLLDTRSAPQGLTGTLVADIVLQLLSYVAQVERECIGQRQAEGIAAAKARGVRFGRPSKERPADYPAVKQIFQRGQITRVQAANRLGVSLSTFDRWRKHDKEAESRNLSR